MLACLHACLLVSCLPTTHTHGFHFLLHGNESTDFGVGVLLFCFIVVVVVGLGERKRAAAMSFCGLGLSSLAIRLSLRRLDNCLSGSVVGNGREESQLRRAGLGQGKKRGKWRRVPASSVCGRWVVPSSSQPDIHISVRIYPGIRSFRVSLRLPARPNKI
ncbi:hypothetical protein B0T26DRAFT_688246 [Lasiosphaeria miniovina]|uniref:Secreted protein n=1 Tax=Lasiosphaeria miniovina TaxID=1954250 RepID=A0AA40BHL1_9PEZI|nr:uncharacterized protein B0T26DRAFT_688246 [Lasiosphaeria miniovina]KAK0734370.1 hypothetical protein B0T26DRAFT_688246 [Lasiosphaeria miniovina]